MATKTISSGESTRGFTFKLVMNETIDIETNTSSIAWSLQLSLKSGSGWGFDDFGIGYSAYINGTRVIYHDRYSSSDGYPYRYSLHAGGTYTFGSGTISVPHDTDGTKTINCSASMTMATSPSGAGDLSCSGSWVLETIPRASSLSIPTLTIESSATLTITAASNTFTHEISYVMSDLSGTIATLGAGVSSTSWTPPNTFYAKIPNATQGNVTITLDTYTGATLIGSNSYTVPVLVGSSIKPTVPNVTLSPVNTNAWLSSQGLYVGGYTKVRVQSSASPGSGASITSYQISGAFSGTGSDYTSGVLTAGVKSITVTVTDSRGRSNTKTSSVTFLDYANPSLTTFTAERGTYSGGSWTSNVNGNHIRVTAIATVSLTGNTGTKSVTVGGTSPSATSGNYYYWTNTNNTTTYVASGTVTDSLGNSSSKTLTISTVEVPFNINVDLPGIGVGMIAQKSRVFQFPPGWSVEMDGVAFPDVNATSKVLGMNAAGTKLEWKALPVVPTLAPVATSGDYDDLTNKPTIVTPVDYVVEEGTAAAGAGSTDNGTWTYRKWNSGIAECWATFSHTITAWQAWGYAYEGTPYAQYAYPTGFFTELPQFFVTIVSPSLGIMGNELYLAPTKDMMPRFYPLRSASSSSSVTLSFYIYAIGKWK